MKTVKVVSKIDNINHAKFEGLYIVRKRLYKIKIKLEKYITSPSKPYSYIRDLDSDCLVWDNIDNLKNVEIDTSRKEAQQLLDKEVKYMKDILKKMVE